MSVRNCDRFLSECITRDEGKPSGLNEDDIYGLYLSWCFLKGETPCSDGSLWAALAVLGHAEPDPAPGRRVWRGLGMTGPAAVDYILASQPSLV